MSLTQQQVKPQCQQTKLVQTESLFFGTRCALCYLASGSQANPLVDKAHKPEISVEKEALGKKAWKIKIKKKKQIRGRWEKQATGEENLVFSETWSALLLCYNSPTCCQENPGMCQQENLAAN